MEYSSKQAACGHDVQSTSRQVRAWCPGCNPVVRQNPNTPGCHPVEMALVLGRVMDYLENGLERSERGDTWAARMDMKNALRLVQGVQDDFHKAGYVRHLPNNYDNPLCGAAKGIVSARLPDCKDCKDLLA